MTELLFKDEAFAIYGAAIEVHKELGPGFLEAVYQEALEIELQCRSIPFDDQLSKKEEAQVLNYLKATGLRVGLLLNFGSEGKLERRRLVR